MALLQFTSLPAFVCCNRFVFLFFFVSFIFSQIYYFFQRSILWKAPEIYKAEWQKSAFYRNGSVIFTQGESKLFPCGVLLTTGNLAKFEIFRFVAKQDQLCDVSLEVLHKDKKQYSPPPQGKPPTPCAKVPQSSPSSLPVFCPPSQTWHPGAYTHGAQVPEGHRATKWQRWCMFWCMSCRVATTRLLPKQSTVHHCWRWVKCSAIPSQSIVLCACNTVINSPSKPRPNLLVSWRT